jgi:hypothetical protein
MKPLQTCTLIGGGVLLAVAFLAYGAPIVLRLLLGYAAVMLWVTAGTRAWIERIVKHPDLNAAGREQNKNAVLVVATFLGIILSGLLVVCIATTTAFQTGTATAIFWAMGSLFSGGFLGFLFSLPKVVEADKGTKDGEKPPATPPGTLQVNTSLNEIADWLTKIIVGVSLVNAQTAYSYFKLGAKTLGSGLAITKDGTVATAAMSALSFAAGLIVTFFILGLMGTYLLTRLWISAALAQADQATFGAFSGAGVNERDLEILENETRSLSCRDTDLPAAASDVAKRISKLDISALHTWREYAAWAKAKSALGQHDDAIRGYQQAVQLYPESAELRLDFAVALFQAEQAARRSVTAPKAA